MNKILLIGIMLVLAYCQGGYYLVMRNSQDHQKELIKEKIFNKLGDDEMELVSLTDNQQKIYWEEEGKEFLLNGEMYDVVKSKTVNGKIVLYCINDKKEKELIDRYNSITKHNSSSDKKSRNNVDDSVNYFFDDKRPSGSFDDVNSKSVFPSYVSGLHSVTPGKITPPPKV